MFHLSKSSENDHFRQVFSAPYLGLYPGLYTHYWHFCFKATVKDGTYTCLTGNCKIKELLKYF